jgi:hypothetical protein
VGAAEQLLLLQLVMLMMQIMLLGPLRTAPGAALRLPVCLQHQAARQPVQAAPSASMEQR